MPTVVSSTGDIAADDDCDACRAPENQGLCHSERCRRQVLPQLRESSLKRDAHSGPFWKKVVNVVADRAETKTEHAERMMRQTRKRDARIGRQLARWDISFAIPG
jgi:hypothetical protein